MNIRNIEQHDNSSIAQIVKASFIELGAPLVNTVYDDPRTERMYEQFAGRRDAAYFVIEEQGEVLGGCGFYPTEGLERGVAEVVKFYFSPALRGKGMGRKMLQQIESKARQAGFSQLYIESFPEFSNAVSLYEKAGFHHIPHRLGNSGHTATTIFMIKEIDRM